MRHEVGVEGMGFELEIWHGAAAFGPPVRLIYKDMRTRCQFGGPLRQDGPAIRRVVANSRRKVVELITRRGTLVYPFANLKLRPRPADRRFN